MTSSMSRSSGICFPLLSLSRCTCIDTRHAQKACRRWSLEMDVALVQYINRLCRHLAITPARLHPHEVYLDPSDAADPRVACLLSMSSSPLVVKVSGVRGNDAEIVSCVCVHRLCTCDHYDVCLCRCTCGEPASAIRSAAVPQQHPGELLPAAGGAAPNTHLPEQHRCTAV